jgi:hypothetical protein
LIRLDILGLTALDSSAAKAADVNRDGYITPLDYIAVRLHILGISEITG